MFPVRRLSPEQASLFRVLRLEARITDPDAFRATLEEEAAKRLEWFEERLVYDPVFGAFVADDVLAGMAGFTPDGGSRHGPPGRVWTVYVRPAYRGRGIGEAVLRTVIDHARHRVPVLHLSCTAENFSARALYERLGFELTSIEADIGPDAHGRRRNEAHYALPLGQIALG